jgi:hypothetical protein
MALIYKPALDDAPLAVGARLFARAFDLALATRNASVAVKRLLALPLRDSVQSATHSRENMTYAFAVRRALRLSSPMAIGY